MQVRIIGNKITLTELKNQDARGGVFRSKQTSTGIGTCPRLLRVNPGSDSRGRGIKAQQ